MQLSHDFCYSDLGMGHLGPSLCLGCHLIFTVRSPSPLLSLVGLSVPKEDLLLTGWLAELGFSPINSSDECLGLLFFLQLRAGRVGFFLASTLMGHSLN